MFSRVGRRSRGGALRRLLMSPHEKVLFPPPSSLIFLDENSAISARRSFSKSSSGPSKAAARPVAAGRRSLLSNESSIITEPKTILNNLSISEAAGHASFAFVTAAYLNSDILVLRLLSCASFSLSIIFSITELNPSGFPFAGIPCCWSST